MSDQNNGDQWNKGYEPPAGSMADEQRRASEAAQRQQEQQWQQQQADESRRQEQADRQRAQRDSHQRNTKNKKQNPQTTGGGQTSDRTSKKQVSKESFSYAWATIGCIAIGMYAYTIGGLEGWPALIIAFIGGIFCGYAYKLLIAVAIIGGLYYFFVYDKKDNDKPLTVLPPTEKVYPPLSNTKPPTNTVSPIPIPKEKTKIEASITVQKSTSGDGNAFNFTDWRIPPSRWETAIAKKKTSIKTVEASYLYSKATAGDATTFRKMDVQHQVTQNGQKGMLVTTTFAVKNLLKMPARLYVNFYHANGIGLQPTDFTNKNPITKQLSVSESFKPIFDNALYEDFKCFIPYSIMPTPSKQNTSLTLNLTIQYKDYLWGKGSDHYAFNWN
jgi:hypothetical protein